MKNFIWIMLLLLAKLSNSETSQIEYDILEMSRLMNNYEYPNSYSDSEQSNFHTMKNFIWLMLLLLAKSSNSETSQIENELLEMSRIMNTYEYPNSYSEFEQSNFRHGGTFGRYDFIIIGAGSAGNVLARRLSEEKSWKILLLEAGQNETEVSQIPGAAGLLPFTNMTWGFTTVQQNHSCLGMDEQKCAVPRGKTLGGSSAINFMMYTRGNRHDYDEMEAAGNLGWGYDSVLPYFRKLENASSEGNFSPVYHNFNGPLNMEYVRQFTAMGQSFLDAANEIGRPVLDYNAANEMGYSHLESNTIMGQRCSTNRGYLTPVLGRPNLTVVKGAFVLELLFDSLNKTVEHVKFVVNGTIYKANAKKEVVLSAGSVQSPQILMLSGIGPRKHLESLKIWVKHDLPVGKNLHDHPFLPYCFSSNFTEDVGSMDQMLQDYFNGKGYLTAAGDIQGIGFINTKDPLATHPDVEQAISPNFPTNDGYFKNAFRYSDETMSTYFKPYPVACAPLILLVLLHEKSRGSITLKSASPFDFPNIDLNFFENQEDVDVLIAGLKDAFALINTDAMKKFNVSSLYNPVAGCENFVYMSDVYLDCLLRRITVSIFHLSGTCKMGPRTDPEAVVDYFLKVKGISNLRVVDASIIPSPLSAHTNIPTIMIGEKGSDIIKQAYGVPTTF